MTVAIPQDVVFRRLGRESVLLHLGTGRYFGLDEVGTLIWTLLAAGTSLPEIERRILEQYEVDADTVHGDVVRILDQLQSRELLEVGDGDSAGP